MNLGARDPSRLVYDILDYISLREASPIKSKVIPLEVYTDEAGLKIKAEVPGLSEKEIEISIEDSILTISGEKIEHKSKIDEEAKFCAKEIEYGTFSRSIALPEEADTDSCSAKYRNGLLEITVLKAKEKKSKTKKIKITA